MHLMRPTLINSARGASTRRRSCSVIWSHSRPAVVSERKSRAASSSGKQQQARHHPLERGKAVCSAEESSSTSARRLQSERARRRAAAAGSNSSSPLVVRAKHASDIVYRQPSDCSSKGWKYEKVIVFYQNYLAT